MDPFETPEEIEEAELFPKTKWYSAWDSGNCSKCHTKYYSGDTVRYDDEHMGNIGQECCG